MKFYYQDEKSGITIYHGDCREFMVGLEEIAVMVTDPPYGIDYFSGHDGILPRSIQGDKDTSLRDWVLCECECWGVPSLVFGTWRIPRPDKTRMVLVWDTKGALGMGALDLPWKPAHQEIYVVGKGFSGHRGSDVLCHAPVQSTAKNGRVHPHQKPVSLLLELLGKSPAGQVFDPFMGSGTTLVAAKQLGRPAVAIELEERYCEVAAKRLGQECLFGLEISK